MEKNLPYKNAYFYTQTIKPALYPYSPEDQYKKSIDDLKTILKGYQCKVFIELTDTYNVHYHTIVYCDNQHTKYLLCKRIYASSANRLSGLGKMFTVNPFTSKDEYEHRLNVYVNKDKDRTLEYIKCISSNCVYDMSPIDEKLDNIKTIVNDFKKQKEHFENHSKRFLRAVQEFESIKSDYDLNYIDCEYLLKDKLTNLV